MENIFTSIVLFMAIIGSSMVLYILFNELPEAIRDRKRVKEIQEIVRREEFIEDLANQIEVRLRDKGNE